MIQTPPGFVAILTSWIESAGGDLDEIREWVHAQGGEEGRSEAERSHGLRAGRLVAPPPHVERYFAVPIESLN
jgi:hypothetical protein